MEVVVGVVEASGEEVGGPVGGAVLVVASVVGDGVAGLSVVGPAAVGAGGDEELALVDEVVAAGAVAGEVGQVGGSAVFPGVDVVDLEVGAVAAGVEAVAALSGDDRVALLGGRQPAGAADGEDLAAGSGVVDGDEGAVGVAGQPGQQQVGDRSVVVEQRRFQGPAVGGTATVTVFRSLVV